MFPLDDVELKFTSYSLLSHSTFFCLAVTLYYTPPALAITYWCGLLLKCV